MLIKETYDNFDRPKDVAMKLAKSYSAILFMYYWEFPAQILENFPEVCCFSWNTHKHSLGVVIQFSKHVGSGKISRHVDMNILSSLQE